jgi:hypothetical protein
MEFGQSVSVALATNQAVAQRLGVDGRDKPGHDGNRVELRWHSAFARKRKLWP